MTGTDTVDEARQSSLPGLQPMSHDDAVKMVESLVSAAMGAAMLDLPPMIALATYQHLEKEKLRVVSELVKPNE